MMKCVYPGSFDPFTIGHLAVVNNAAKLFDEVVILIAMNPDKPNRRFPLDKMSIAIEKTLEENGLTNVKIDYEPDFTADYIEEHDVDYIVRGLRTMTDYASEEDMADKNERLSGVDTVYLRAGKYGYISSSYVDMLFKSKKRKHLVIDLVPPAVLACMKGDNS